MKWVRYYADIVPKNKVVIIKKQVYDSNNKSGNFRKKNLITTVEKVIKFETDIPLKEKEVYTEHFDSNAFQSDDRFFTTSRIVKVYDNELIKAEIDKAMVGYNTEPKLLNSNL